MNIFTPLAWMAPPDLLDDETDRKPNKLEIRIHNYRWKVFYVLCGLSLSVMLLGFSSTTGIPVMGSLAWGSDVDKKIEQAVGPIKDKVDALERSVNEQTSISKAFLARLAQEQIRDTIKLWCKASSEELRERFERDFDRYTEEWRRATDSPKGTVYRKLDCRSIAEIEEER